jgi:hypothetical protein
MHSQLNLVGIFLDIHHIITCCNFLLTQFAPSSFQCYIPFPREARLGCNSAGLKIIEVFLDVKMLFLYYYLPFEVSIAHIS